MGLVALARGGTWWHRDVWGLLPLFLCPNPNGIVCGIIPGLSSIAFLWWWEGIFLGKSGRMDVVRSVAGSSDGFGLEICR